MASPKSPKKVAVDLTLTAVSKALGSKLSKPSFDYLKGLPKVQRDAILGKVKSGAFNTKNGQVSLSQVKTAVGKLDKDVKVGPKIIGPQPFKPITNIQAKLLAQRFIVMAKKLEEELTRLRGLNA